MALAISDTFPENSKSGLWLLFIASAFPIHIWAYIILLRDISWVAERTNFLDALGFIGYGLSFSLVESALLWLFLGSVGALFLKKSNPEKRLILLSLLGWIFLLVALLISLKNSGILQAPENLIPSLENCPLSDWLLLGVVAAVLFPVIFFILRSSLNSQKFISVFKKILQRISPLMGLYLVIDLLGLLLILIRNLIF